MSFLLSWWKGSTPKGKYFGRSLEEISTENGDTKQILPKFLIAAVSFLDEHLDTEFLFRQPGSKALVEEYIARIDKGEEINFSEEEKCKQSPYIVADILKQYLRSLPEPLVTGQYREQFLSSITGTSDEYEQMERLRQCIESLPPKNAALLDFIISLASRIAAKSEINKMNARALATCLAPALIGVKDSVCSSSVEVNIVELMITQQPNLFRMQFHPLANSLTMAPKDSLHQIKNKEEQAPKQGVNILTLDGGGMRGVIEIKILTVIAEQLFGDADINGTRKLLSKFDLIAGTSTGAILALAMQKKSLKEVREWYYNLGSQIFQSGFFWNIGRYYRSGDFYSGEMLEKVFSEFFGDEVLINYAQEGMPKIFIVSTDASQSMWEPFLFRNYRNPNSLIAGTSNATIPLSLRASTAAPTYFSQVTMSLLDPPVEVPMSPVSTPAETRAQKPEETPSNTSSVCKVFVDGGMVANNPTELAIFEAHRLFPDRNINCILSVGTGLPGKTGGSVNLLRMLSEIIDLCTSSNAIHERVSEWIQMTHPKPHYFRFSPTNGEGSLPLDTSDVKLLNQVEESTEAYLKQPEIQAQIHRLKEILLQR